MKISKEPLLTRACPLLWESHFFITWHNLGLVVYWVWCENLLFVLFISLKFDFLLSKIAITIKKAITVYFRGMLEGFFKKLKDKITLLYLVSLSIDICVHSSFCPRLSVVWMPPWFSLRNCFSKCLPNQLFFSLPLLLFFFFFSDYKSILYSLGKKSEK